MGVGAPGAAARAVQYGELMVPRQIVTLAALPPLGSGKTDYVALTELLRQQLVRAAQVGRGCPARVALVEVTVVQAV